MAAIFALSEYVNHHDIWLGGNDTDQQYRMLYSAMWSIFPSSLFPNVHSVYIE